MLILFFFLLGLIIGSFLNVVVLRLESEKTLSGRSQCPSCGKLIRWYDNIPVLSFFLLGRRCRECHFPISWQYPTVEFATGVLFALFGTLAIGTGTMADLVFTAWWLILVSLFIVIALYDARNMEIPLVLLLVGVIAAATYALTATALAPGNWFDAAAPWRDMLWGGGIAALIFYALVYFSHETWMGMGDVWLAGIAGAAIGLPALLILFTLSFSIGSVIGITLLWLGKRGMKSQIPFAPFLVAGTLLTLFVQAVDPWWLSLFLFSPI
ncbi:MAG: prepilin peptidase [Candidatus Moraniibacteriota bacterium]|nr:MAG: prepilin peptidase [Candidatus Moranbacteria bacterium]